MASTIQSFARLSDDDLLATVKRLALTEQRATSALVRSLMEVDVRRLYLGEGYSSLFTYCTQALHLAEGAAYNRIEAARAARRFPDVLTALEEGSVTLTAVRLLAPLDHGQSSTRPRVGSPQRQARDRAARCIASSDAGGGGNDSKAAGA